jgi:oligoribonuclease
LGDTVADPDVGAPLVWVDLEMSGLDPERDGILEMAVLLTDAELREVAEGPHLVVHQPDALLDGMDEWNREHHGASGLIAAVKASSTTVEGAEAEVLAFLEAHTTRGQSVLCGNSVHVDRRFLAKQMPRFNESLHYRIIDVSTVKELVRRWYPELPRFEKAEAHRALDDIRASIGELRYYRERVFREPGIPEPQA